MDNCRSDLSITLINVLYLDTSNLKTVFNEFSYFTGKSEYIFVKSNDFGNFLIIFTTFFFMEKATSAEMTSLSGSTLGCVNKTPDKRSFVSCSSRRIAELSFKPMHSGSGTSGILLIISTTLTRANSAGIKYPPLSDKLYDSSKAAFWLYNLRSKVRSNRRSWISVTRPAVIALDG